MSDAPLGRVNEPYARKDDWHRAQARLPVKEKVRILLELQAQDLPLIARHRPLRTWSGRGPSSPESGTCHRAPSRQLAHLQASVTSLLQECSRIPLTGPRTGLGASDDDMQLNETPMAIENPSSQGAKKAKHVHQPLEGEAAIPKWTNQ